MINFNFDREMLYMNGGLNLNVYINLEMLRIHAQRWECHKLQIELWEIM